jgi:nucleoside-diphosphate-sugar epimerase
MRAVVTGGTGFLGSHLVSLLQGRGAEVRVLLRPGTPPDRLPAAVGHRVGDVRDAAALGPAFAGADVVFHLAALTAPWGPRAPYLETNVGGTAAVAAACQAAGVSRLVYVSSMVVLGIECDRRGLGEDAPYAATFVSPYEESKVRAEQLVRERARATGLPVTVLRPGMGWGPRERVILPGLIRALRSPLFFMVGHGRNTLDLSYAGNVAEALWLAATREEAAGRVYNVADGFGITCREYLAALAGALGLRVPRRRLPRGLVQFLMRVVFPPQAEPSETMRGPSAEALLRLCALFRDSEPDTGRIRRELAFRPPVDFPAGILETAAWLRKAYPQDAAP